MKHTSLLSSLAHAFQIPLRRPFIASSPSLSLIRSVPRSTPTSHSFSTSPVSYARKNDKRPTVDRRVTLIRYYLHHPTTIQPRGLRFSRLRALRHWTITRAWSLYNANLRKTRELELERQYNAMRAACEELRIGVGDGGRLFRQAMSKKGLRGGRSDLGVLEGREKGERGRVPKGLESGVPVEYSRGLVEYPARVGWDDAWRR